MQIRDSSSTYGFTSILLHWVSAILIGVLFVSGEVMEEMSRGPDKGELAGVHQSLGMLLLGIVFARLFWRITQGFPDPVDAKNVLLNKLSRIWHWLMLVAIIAMPVSGYLASETGRRGLNFFGLWALPDLIGANHDLHEMFEDVHETVGKVVILLVIVHVAGAFVHHFKNRDQTLKRMTVLRNNS